MIAVVVILAILAFHIWSGYKKGLVHIVLDLCSTLLAVILACMLVQPINTFLRENTPVYTWIESQSEKLVGNIDEENLKELETYVGSGQEAFKKAALTVMEKLNIPEGLQESVVSINLEGYLSDGVKSVRDLIVVVLTDYIGGAIIFVILFVIIKIALGIVIKMTNIINHIPLVGSVNKLAGVAAGAFHGVLIIWVAFMVINMFSNTEWAQYILTGVTGNPITNFIYESNLIMNIISK